MINFKKAAMFGLDARIALAIFGALSVISGAALYSAIQNSKVVAAVTYANEFFKAIEQYMLDTGLDLPSSKISATTYTHSFDPANIVENNSVSGWNGPYFTLSKDATYPNYHINGYSERSVLSGQITIKRARNNTWTAPDSNGNCDGSSACFVWIEVTYPANFAKAIDLYVDGANTADTGNIRLRQKDAGDITKGFAVYFKGPLTLKQTI